MDNLAELVFYGEILPGHDLATVKSHLASLLKVQPEQIAAVFSGRRVVLRKGLSPDESAKYLAHLQKIGVHAVLEMATPTAVSAVLPPPAVAPAASTPNATPSATLYEVALEEVTCPKCGERQPSRTLCRSCAVDMKRFFAAQKEAEEIARVERIAAKEAQLEHRRAVFTAEPSPAMLGFSFAGRMGRFAYAGGCFLTWAILVFAFILTLKTQMFSPFLVALLITSYLSVRLMILRCHDRDWSGWLWLVCLVPLVGAVFMLMLLLMPGTELDNEYGAHPQSAGPFKFLMTLAVSGLAVMVLMRQPDGREMLIAMSGLAPVEDVDDVEDAVVPRALHEAPRRVELARNESAPQPAGRISDVSVEIYTTSSCGYCHQAMAYMNQRGISYVEKNVELSNDAVREFMSMGGGGVPYILFSNGKKMRGFEATTFERHLSSS